MIDDDVVSIVFEVERWEKKQKSALANKNDVYLKAKRAGLNVKALRRIIAERKMPDREQVEADAKAYRMQLGMAIEDVANGASLREAGLKHGIAKSTIHDAVRREEESEVGQPAGSRPQVAAATRAVAEASSPAEVPAEEDDDRTPPPDTTAETGTEDDNSLVEAYVRADGDGGPIPRSLDKRARQ